MEVCAEIKVILSSHAILSSAVVFFLKKNQLFLKILSGIPPECQILWIQFRPDILSGLIWVQTVCKGYQQTRLSSRQRYGNP